jgi:hypothetical protein
MTRSRPRRRLSGDTFDYLHGHLGLDDLVTAFERQDPTRRHVEFLRALVNLPDPDTKLVQALERCWSPLQERLAGFQSRKARPVDPQLAGKFAAENAEHFVHWLVLTLARDVVRPSDPEELRYLLYLGNADDRMLRHLLTYTGDVPPWTWRRVLKDSRRALGQEFGVGYWPDSEAGDLLVERAIGSAVRPGFVRAVRALPAGCGLDVLPVLARFDRELALEWGTEPAVAADRQLIQVALTDRDLRQDAIGALMLLSVGVLDRHAADTGKAIGFLVQKCDLPRTASSIAMLIGRPEVEVSGRLVTDVAMLWADLAQLVRYRDGRFHSQEQVRGVLDQLAEHADRFPAAWAASIHELLHEAQQLGQDCTDLIAYAAVKHPEVQSALAAVATSTEVEVAVVHRARGIATLVGGVADPGQEYRSWVAGTAARAFDGTPMTPRRLSSLSKTWLGELDLEEALAATLREALRKFGDWFRDQGAAVEETGTGVLLTRIETAFEAAHARTDAGGRTAPGREVSVSHRPVRKNEERDWGCDIALLLEVDLKNLARMQAAALVQVKKSEAINGGTYERWKIDLSQLKDLLRVSAASFYWLVMSTGEVLCVRAQWVQGVVAGHGVFESRQKSYMLGYENVRHTCVTLDQFLPELFLGAWVGDTHDETLAFARGTAQLRPRYLFEVILRTQD